MEASLCLPAGHDCWVDFRLRHSVIKVIPVNTCWRDSSIEGLIYKMSGDSCMYTGKGPETIPYMFLLCRSCFCIMRTGWSLMRCFPTVSFCKCRVIFFFFQYLVLDYFSFILCNALVYINVTKNFFFFLFGC